MKMKNVIKMVLFVVMVAGLVGCKDKAPSTDVEQAAAVPATVAQKPHNKPARTTYDQAVKAELLASGKSEAEAEAAAAQARKDFNIK